MLTKLEQGQSLVLLEMSKRALEKRIFLEEACGYPENTWGDSIVLKRLKQFLDTSHISEMVKVLLKSLSQKGKDNG